MKKYVLLPLMLLALSANAGNNTYDGSTGILTIPSVTVGSTNYTNVVVRLKSFDVLSYDPYPSVGQLVDGVLFTFNSCYLKNNQLTCNLTIQSNDQSRTMGFGPLDMELIDDKGNSYTASSLQIANSIAYSKNHDWLWNKVFAANISTPMQIVFDNINYNATAVGLLTINYADSKGYAQKSKFTNSPFIISTPPNPF